MSLVEIDIPTAHRRPYWAIIPTQIIKDKDTQQLILNGRVRTMVNGTSIVAADGLVHVIDVEDNSDSNVFSDLNIDAAEMIPRKALYAMHFSYLGEVN